MHAELLSTRINGVEKKSKKLGMHLELDKRAAAKQRLEHRAARVIGEPREATTAAVANTARGGGMVCRLDTSISQWVVGPSPAFFFCTVAKSSLF